MVFRVYVEKKQGFDVEAKQLANELKTILGIASLKNVRLVNRYDVEGISEELFAQATPTVFSEPQVDNVSADLPDFGSDNVFAVEYLPGQFDQRADSASECIQLISQGERPTVRSAKVYALEGELGDDDIAAIKHYVINPVEAREASLDTKTTLKTQVPVPGKVEIIEGFRTMSDADLEQFIADRGLAMDLADLQFCRAHFTEEQRDPTITEIKVIDTYWSDHCRHTTFGTQLDDVQIDDATVQAAFDKYLEMRHELGRDEKPVCLMDMGTIGAKWLKKNGILKNLDESEEINACTVKVKVDVNGHDEDWLFLFKNETHNHPTEIEPFGGAATCIGGCIRDPLSGRSYVYQAMRVTGAADPTVPVSETLEGKLPQRKLVTTAAAGYSSYGNQIGLATGHVAEVYHDGYVAKHLEVGAVVGAAPASNVVRERPAPGDVVVLLGGRTGRDGIGGATGSSKSHNKASLTTMASEVQKGNAPEERKIQRLFRDSQVTRMIKRCNDFGAGGVSVAIGELAAGLRIDLDAVRKKYDGLDGTELAISESQERMAVVVAPEDADRFIAAAQAENLEAYPVAVVTESPRMVMTWKGQTIADLSRAFLDTNGADKHTSVTVPDRSAAQRQPSPRFRDLRDMASSLKCASRRGLTERFDGSIGAASVLMPFGGSTQRTPAQSMAALLPVLPGQSTDLCSVMAWGFDPDTMVRDPFTGAAASVVDSMAKLVAAGCDRRQAYLTFQEYFEKLRDEPLRWGKPFSALLGALDAQLGLDVAAIGGKDSMSGSFLDLAVPPTLISFAIAPAKAGEVLTPEFKGAGHPVYLLPGFPSYGELKTAWDSFHQLCRQGKVKAAWAVEAGGVAEAVMKMSFGNSIGFQADVDAAAPWYGPCSGAIVFELEGEEFLPGMAWRIGTTTQEPVITIGEDTASVAELLERNEGVLEQVYPTRAGKTEKVEAISCGERAPIVCQSRTARPRAVIPVFPGTNCEYDTAQACLRAGIQPEIVVVRNLSTDLLAQSAQALEEAIRRSQMVVLPGGFSGGDEPDGSGKFIASFLRNPRLTDAIHDLLRDRDGLMLGICNGFQALIKLGLVPFGEIRDTDAACPTLTYNVIGRHQSRIVRTRVASNRSPWLTKVQVGDIVSVPISHGEGRFLCPPDLLAQLAENGQIATQYVDLDGHPTMDIGGNPNGSVWSVEGITSPDGRVFGKMGHAERVGPCLYRNIPGNYDLGLFDAAKDYFSL